VGSQMMSYIENTFRSDPLWPDESGYGYVGGRAPSLVDATGRQKAKPPRSVPDCRKGEQGAHDRVDKIIPGWDDAIDRAIGNDSCCQALFRAGMRGEDALKNLDRLFKQLEWLHAVAWCIGRQETMYRYDDSSTGTFITRDPIKDGRNWYSYCDNNPVTRVDADGLLHIDISLGEDGLGTGRLVADPGDIIGHLEILGVKIPIFAAGGEVLHEFVVGNRVPNSGGFSSICEGNGPYPPGNYTITGWYEDYKTLGSTIKTDGRVPLLRGTWIHTGKGENYRSSTLGCIRLRQSDMDIIFMYLNMNKGGRHTVNVKQKGKRSKAKQADLVGPRRIRDRVTRS
jgi:hypothetical protein